MTTRTSDMPSPTPDLVERVARAIMEAEPYNLSPDEAMNCARGALSAIPKDDAVREESARMRAALTRLSSSFTGGWAGMFRDRAEVIAEVEAIARAALSQGAKE